MTYVDNLRNFAHTENLCLSHKSSTNPVLDLFSSGGSAEELDRDLLMRCWEYNKDLTLRCLLYLRDISGGQGRRLLFRQAMGTLWMYGQIGGSHPIIHRIPDLGRWDDILSLLNTRGDIEILKFLSKQLKSDINSQGQISLLGKWLPSINAKNKKNRERARMLCDYMGIRYKTYRKCLKQLRNKLKILEHNLSYKDYASINYERVPARAMRKYKKAFENRDAFNYQEYLNSVAEGKKEIKAGTVYPYEIVKDILQGQSAQADLMWANMPDFCEGKDPKTIVVADVSGSMREHDYIPLANAIALAIYFSERISGIFKDKFLTFSATPELCEVIGNSISEKVRSIKKSNWGYNTNIEATFSLLLAACKNAADMPDRVLIISDMEFDSCSDGQTAVDNARAKYASAGYRLPRLVFWNVSSRTNHFPALSDSTGVQLVSGYSPSILRQILSTGNTTPEEFMLEVLGSDRYDYLI